MKIHIVEDSEVYGLCGNYAIMFGKDKKEMYVKYPHLKENRYCKKCLKIIDYGRHNK